MIPKIAHFYFGGREWSFLRYLSVYSFVKLNPKYKTIVHVPMYPYFGKPTWNTQEHSIEFKGKNYDEEVFKLPIELNRVNFKELGIPENIPESFKADYIRLYLLGENGGWFFDTDILFLKPMSKLKVPKGTRIVMCKNENNRYLIGMQGACKQNDFFYILFQLAKQGKRDPSGYQSIGSAFLKGIDFETRGAYNFPKELLYEYDDTRIAEIFDCNKNYPLGDHAIGIHWYGGHPIAGEWENVVTHKNYKEYDNMICNKRGEVYEDNNNNPL